jgi:Zn-dependent protease
MIVLVPVLLMGLTFHEFSHGWMAYRFGDDTAKRAGRLTLNPLAHLDPIGTLMILFVHFGWARPVPIDPTRMRNPKRDSLLVALAGPFSNLLLALLFAILLRVSIHTLGSLTLLESSPGLVKGWVALLITGVEINIALAFFNLIPIHPLDGSRVLSGLLPLRQAYAYSRLEPYGFLILLGLIIAEHSWGIPVFRLLVWYPVEVVGGVLTGIPWWMVRGLLLHLLTF